MTGQTFPLNQYRFGSPFTYASRDVDTIYDKAAPVPGGTADPAATAFLLEVRRLVQKAITAGGGRLVGLEVNREAVAELGVPLNQTEISDLWKAEHSRVPGGLPSVHFEVDGKVVRMSAAPHHRPVTPDSLKRPFQIAMHRKYPDLKIDSLDSGVPAV